MAHADVPVREGDVLAGKYRVERVLGIGGMGVVVSAMHEQLGQRVALKFMLPHALRHPESVARFLREARAAARLKSEHIVRVHDVGTLESGSPYIVMELLEGVDAGKLLEQGPMSITRAIELILQACVAVAEAHAAGIIHRDLKPQNLFVTKRADGELVKVLDFGISKDTSELKPGGTELTKTEAMLGSPHYMSPEQLKSSKDVDARTDVWSLGVCLFQLLSGKLPYEAPSIAELCLKVLSQPPASLAKLAPSVPAPLVSVVEKCLAQERQQRWANITDLALALEPFADARGKMFIEHVKAAGIAPSSTALPPARIDPHPTSPTVNAWGTASSSPKRRSVIWVVVGGALILGFGATMSYMLARPKSKPIASHAHALVSTAASAAPSVSLVPLATASAPVASASAQPSARPAPARTTTKASGTNKDAGAIDLFQDRN